MSEWLTLALIAGVIFGLQIVAIKAVLNSVSPVMASFLQFSIVAFTFFGYALFSERIIFPAGSTLLLVAVAAVLLAAGNVFFFRSLAAAENPGYSIAAVSINIVVASLVSIFAFNLKISPIGIAGIAFVLVGVYLLNMIE
jgi:drug/metabolite transporter (DMT)-like permease